jgi:Trypsin-like peptidase domain
MGTCPGWPGWCAPRLAVAAALLLALALGRPAPALGDDANLLDSVFELFTTTRQGEGIARGTAFFIDPSGLALTNSHVVNRVQHDPEHYVLLAVVGNEFYGVEILCASPLEVDPVEASKGPVSRDIAEIRLVAPAAEFSQWTIRAAPGATVLARAHQGPLPAFSVLTLGDGPQESGQVRVLGFIRAAQAMEKAVATGTVTQTAVATDGTPVFEIQSPDRPERGSSGSPVLDGQDRVVGMYTWNDTHDPASGIAISSAALAHACP